MGTIHPSRLALVPHDPKDLYPSRGRSPSPRSSRNHSPSRDWSKDYSPNRHRSSSAKEYRDRDYERRRDDDRRDNGRPRDNDRRDRDEKRNDERAARPRRPSPEYSEYRRQSSPRRSPPRQQESQAPWRQHENMYPPRGGRSYGNDGGGDYFETCVPSVSQPFVLAHADVFLRRRQQRMNSTLSIWPPSPKAPASEL